MGKIRQRVMSCAQPRQSCHLTAVELLSHEVACLKKMATVRWPGKMVKWQSEFASAYRNANTERSLNIHVFFEAKNPRNQDISYEIALGARVIASQAKEATYSIALVEKKNGVAKGIRKIHFDLDFENSENEPKPNPHVQFGGGMSPKLEESWGATVFDHLRLDVEKPRIPCLPKSFALLLHIALLEFHTTVPEIGTLVQTPEWIKIVHDSEVTILMPHYLYCYEWLKHDTAKNVSLLSHFYGVSV